MLFSILNAANIYYFLLFLLTNAQGMSSLSHLGLFAALTRFVFRYLKARY